MAIRVHRRDDESPVFETRDFAGVRPADFERQIRAERLIRVDKPRARRLILGVRKSGFGARATLDCDFRAQSDEFLHCLGRRRDAGFSGVRFGRNSDQHETFPRERQAS